MNKKEIQELAQIIRGLSIDGVESANSGHPGLPLGMADVAAVLWTQFLKHNPKNPSWFDRDRFVLSAGHGSMLVYSLLHLFGYNLPLKELKRFRQWKSKTAGHPEYHETPGVETTTGPLGQGISNAVGMALAEKSLASRFNTSRNKLVDHHTYVIASDGDLMEGVSHEASSFAGHNRLNKLIVLYDDNNISIDGETDLSFSENVIQRFKAYGWHTQKIDGHDLDAIKSAIEAAHATDQPSLIACRTIIGYGSPNKAGTESVHGSPLGKVEARLTKEVLGLPVNKSFYVSPPMKKLKEKAKRQGVIAEKRWKERYKKYRLTYPTRAKLFEACLQKEVSETAMAVPAFDTGKIATRSASGKVLDYLANHVPALMGGSADLTPSNKTFPKGEKAFSKADPQGRYVHYGVREHAMAAIMNGMALHGGVIPYGGTFFVFTDYMRPSMRLAALMGIQSIYVLT
ncbi:MAG: transketolase, partial [Saprospiraceae bacterium]|nr:transketolase [Saprospiraceae bacterium]